MDQRLASYAREYIARARPELEPGPLDDYLRSSDFERLVTTFDAKLLEFLGQYLKRSAPPVDPAAPRKMHFADLSPVSEPVSDPVAAPEPMPIPASEIAFRLPTARAGSAYRHPIEALGANASPVFVDIIVPPELALTADLDSGTMEGTPATAGEHVVKLVYHPAGQPELQRQASVTCTVLPDPRSMWKDLPSEREDPYWKQDAASASLRGTELAILAASKRGRSHAHVGSFRDDDMALAHLPDQGWYMAVVADGAGSARFSRRGAAIICAEAQARILASLTDSASAQIDAAAEAYASERAGGVDARHQDLHTALSRVVGNAAYYAARAIHDEVTSRADLGGAFKDYASTALIAVCKRYPFGTLCAAYWVGDGAVGVYSRRNGITLLGDVDSGEFSGQTRFLDNAAVDHEVLRSRTRFALVEDMTALVLMTDGISDAKFETEARLARAADWDALWDDLDGAVGFTRPGSDEERQARLLAWLDFWSQGNHDDRTIALIYQDINQDN